MPMSALKGDGSAAVAERAIEYAQKQGGRNHVCGGVVEHALAHIEESIESRSTAVPLQWYAVKLFEKDEKVKNS